MANEDKIFIEILADGTARITTDKISAPNHKKADELINFIITRLGGQMTRTRRRDVHGHVHTHEHEHR